MNALQNRRVVTGHNAEGKAVFLVDDVLTSLSPVTGKPPEGSNAGMSNVYRTAGLPANVNEPFVDYYGQNIPFADEAGATCRFCHFLPVKDLNEDKLNVVHRTESIDFGVVLKGQIELTLDDGVKTILRQGDVVVQQGTIHDWLNSFDEVCVMMFVLIPADKVKVQKTGEILDAMARPR